MAGSKIVRAFLADAERLPPEEKAAITERVTTLTTLLKTEGTLSKEAVTKLADPMVHDALVSNGRQLQDALSQLLGEGAATVAAKNLANSAKRALAATALLAARAQDAVAVSTDPNAAARLQNRSAQTTASLPLLADAIKYTLPTRRDS